MSWCAHCHYLVPLDDVTLPLKEGRCVCVACWNRLIEDTRPMPAELRRMVADALPA